MNKNEAKKAIEKGEKVTHRYFDSDEFVTTKRGDSMTYFFEDGEHQSSVRFWHTRNQAQWTDGWSIFTQR